jgi:hypothetical protein
MKRKLQLLFLLVLITSGAFSQYNHSSLLCIQDGDKILPIAESNDSIGFKRTLIENLFPSISLKNKDFTKPISYIKIQPLFNTNVGFDSHKKQTTYATGIGVSFESQWKNKFKAFAKVYQENGHYASYTDSVARANGVMPYAGFAHELPDGNIYFWNNSFGLSPMANFFIVCFVSVSQINNWSVPHKEIYNCFLSVLKTQA